MSNQLLLANDPEVVATSILEVIGPPPRFETLIRFMQVQRGKRLVLEECPMPIGITGKCFALADVDLILTRPGLTPQRKMHTQIHEIIHLLRGELPDLWEGQPPSYDEFCQRSKGFLRQYSETLNRGSVYDDLKEQIAESTAAILFAHITHSKSDLPVRSKHFYS